LERYKTVIGLLIESVSKGGNLLLNVGPTARGTFDYRANEKLEEMGEWMKYNNRSIYGCTEAPPEFKVPDNCLLTYNPETNRLYIHLLDYPMKWFTIEGYQGSVKYAQFLHDGSEILFGKPRSNVTHQEVQSKDDIILILPMIKPNIEIPVIELILE